MSLLDQVRELSMGATESCHEAATGIATALGVIDEVAGTARELGQEATEAAAEEMHKTAEEAAKLLAEAAEKIDAVTTAAARIAAR
jgi:hypothetical protein